MSSDKSIDTNVLSAGFTGILSAGHIRRQAASNMALVRKEVASDAGAIDWYGLGPISVAPERQGQGIGTLLMHHALSERRPWGRQGASLMIRLVVALSATFLAATASAQSREAWIRKCQAEDAELSGSTGYRVCTEMYVQHLERRQKVLLRRVSARLSTVTDEGVDGRSAIAHIKKSQVSWRTYVTEHCRAAQDMFGSGHTSGDAIPSCMAGELELRNRQLSRMLQGEYER